MGTPIADLIDAVLEPRRTTTRSSRRPSAEALPMCSTRSGHWSAHRPRPRVRNGGEQPAVSLWSRRGTHSLVHSNRMQRRTHIPLFRPVTLDTVVRMPIRVTPARLRDELTELCVRASAGEQLVAAGVHQAPVLIRPVRRRDRGARTSLTVFRRQLHRILRQAAQEPIIVTVGGDPVLWLGPTAALPTGSGARSRADGSAGGCDGTERASVQPIRARTARPHRCPSAARHP